ncbi:MAG TPA: acyl dehydratase [Nocardioidaceae bacterium]|nr:acyl dehydratase [Nocardioidaceae bacterium]
MSEQEVHTETVDRGPAVALAGLLDIDVPAGDLPPLWHVVYLLERPRQSELGPDGHPVTGIPAPPGPGRKRMFAGGRVETHELLRYDEPATRTTCVSATREKVGRSGPLTFITVRSEYTQAGRLKIVDESDIVYRAPGSSIDARVGTLDDQPHRAEREPSLRLSADVALLFRFSALTYNGHRIHYDQRWTAREGYGDLVVHGPLQALMMAELVRRTGSGVAGRCFSYRLIAPMVGPQAFTVLAAHGGVDTGAEVTDVFGTVTARSAVAPLSR